MLAWLPAAVCVWREGGGSREWGVVSWMCSRNSQQLKVKGAITQRDIKANGCGLSSSFSCPRVFPPVHVCVCIWICMLTWVWYSAAFVVKITRSHTETNTHTHTRIQPCRAKPNRAENEMENIAMRGEKQRNKKEINEQKGKASPKGLL